MYNKHTHISRNMHSLEHLGKIMIVQSISVILILFLFIEIVFPVNGLLIKIFYKHIHNENTGISRSPSRRRFISGLGPLYRHHSQKIYKEFLCRQSSNSNNNSTGEYRLIEGSKFKVAGTKC